MKVKICGLKTEEALLASLAAGADFIGLVFFEKSPRNVSLEQAQKLRRLAGSTPVAAVTVNPDNAFLDTLTKTVKPDLIQLHGHETPARVEQIKTRYGIPVIKAIGVDADTDPTELVAFDTIADMLMFDAKAPEGSALPGGRGVAFDWNMLRGLKLRKPWFLSGGLTPENIREAIAVSKARMVDVSSGVESAAGVKDLQKIRRFIENAKQSETL